MNRRGYLYATADEGRVQDFIRQAEEAAALGAGPVRYHTGAAGEPEYIPADPEGFDSDLTGSDLITDPALIRRHFPYLTERTVAIVHARRCGWLSAQQYGMLMLERARACGVRLVQGRVTGVEIGGGRVQSVQIAENGGGRTLSTGTFVNAAGPYLKQVGRLLESEIPVFSERHMKVAINDHLGVFPRTAPLLIWADGQRLPWSEPERQELAADPETRFLLEEFPPGAHGRPDGPLDSTVALLIWTYHQDPVEPTFPPEAEPFYPEIALRGVAAMIPAMQAYFDRMPRPFVDGGYYTKTQENRLLASPLAAEGGYVIGALSGYGIMASSAAADLLACYITGGTLPPYAPAFHLSRYEDPEYRALLATWGADSGQL